MGRLTLNFNTVTPWSLGWGWLDSAHLVIFHCQRPPTWQSHPHCWQDTHRRDGWNCLYFFIVCIITLLYSGTGYAVSQVILIQFVDWQCIKYSLPSTAYMYFRLNTRLFVDYKPTEACMHVGKYTGLKGAGMCLSSITHVHTCMHSCTYIACTHPFHCCAESGVCTQCHLFLYSFAFLWQTREITPSH